MCSDAYEPDSACASTAVRGPWSCWKVSSPFRGGNMNIQESLHAILQRQDSITDLFYRVFLERYPEVRDHFQGVNLRHQAVLLNMALMVMERHYKGSYPATEMY